MSRVSWYIKDRVLLVEREEVVDRESVEALNRELMGYLENATMPVTILIDMRYVNEYQLSLADAVTNTTVKNTVRHPKIEKLIYIGKGNLYFTFLITIVIEIMRENVIVVESMGDALELIPSNI